MKKAIVSLLAMSSTALASAGSAAASEQDFLDSIASLNHYAIECAGCADDALDVGYKVCRAFDAGGETAAVQAVLNSYNRDDSPNRDYYATLFAQYAAYELCPQHNGEIEPI